MDLIPSPIEYSIPSIRDLEINALNLGACDGILQMMKGRIALVPPVYNIDSNHFKPPFFLIVKTIALETVRRPNAGPHGPCTSRAQAFCYGVSAAGAV